MVEDGVLNDSTAETDQWHHAYRIQCRNDRVEVSSAGRDGEFQTSDDILSSGWHTRGTRAAQRNAAREVHGVTPRIFVPTELRS